MSPNYFKLSGPKFSEKSKFDSKQNALNVVLEYCKFTNRVPNFLQCSSNIFGDDNGTLVIYCEQNGETKDPEWSGTRQHHIFTITPKI